MSQSLRFFLAICLLLSLGCAQGHCRRISEAAPEAVVTPPIGAVKNPTKKDTGAGRHSLVYKYNGEKQCGMGRAVTAEEMRTELFGVEVFSQETKSDGLMHIQVCGSTTGMANVFEIPEKDLDKAKKRGFMEWRMN